MLSGMLGVGCSHVQLVVKHRHQDVEYYISCNSQ